MNTLTRDMLEYLYTSGVKYSMIEGPNKNLVVIRLAQIKIVRTTVIPTIICNSTHIIGIVLYEYNSSLNANDCHKSVNTLTDDLELEELKPGAYKIKLESDWKLKASCEDWLTKALVIGESFAREIQW